MQKLGFIGCGNMATAILQGALAKQKVAAQDVMITCSTPERTQQKAAQLGVCAGSSNEQVAEFADVLFLSVKPQQYEAVIEQVRDLVDGSKVVVTIAPGKTLAWLDARFGKEVKIIRCMPNTPALVAEGLTSYCPNEAVEPEQVAFVEGLLECFGVRLRLPEYLIDAASAVGGSAPAFVYAFIEALADGGVAEGLPRAQAMQVAAQTVLGSAKMVLETGQHPGVLKDQVCSPGGSTIKGMEALEKAAFRGAVIDAVRTTAAAARGL